MRRRRKVIREEKPKTTQAIIDLLLKNRGIKTKKEKEEFFAPRHPKNLKPREFGIDQKQLSKAKKRILEAKKKKEKVIVYGDYDADGICGTAILWETLYKFGINALPYIPERFSEGYGLNLPSLKKLKEDEKVSLVITVDHGIVANKEVEQAKKLGVDVVIVDHHEPGKKLPKASAVVHTQKIAGSGVAWVLAAEFVASEDLLALVAIGTIADLVPVLGPNRSFVKHGIGELRKTKRPGIVALCQEAGIDQARIGTYQIGFVIAPRLNAMGRLEHALDSLRLLCIRDEEKAQVLAGRLGKTNTRRQEMTNQTALHAREQVLLQKSPGLIFLAHEDYHEGIIGLVASRLVEEFYRPAIVVSVGKKHSKGSARSIPGFNIVEHIHTLSEFLVEGGGHPMAAGFTIRTDHIDVFAEKLKEAAKEKLTQNLLSPKLKIDCKLEFNQLNLKLAQTLQSFEPTGVGNPEPTFLTEGIFIQDARLVGAQNQHLKLWLAQQMTNSKQVLEAIWFGMGSIYSTLSPDKGVDIAYSLILDKWNDQEKVTLKIKELKEHEKTGS